jgi:thiol-disulfide isomerase/thioredoxin
MKRILILVLAVAAVALFTSLFTVHATAADKAVSAKSATAKAAAAPADRVVVMYFHRTQRCPTCLRMGTYSEESVTEKFAEAMKKGKVEFHYVDFQDKKNEALTKGYKVSGPTLIVAKVKDNKIKEFKNLKDIWAKNSDPKQFHQYVQENVTAYAK